MTADERAFGNNMGITDLDEGWHSGGCFLGIEGQDGLWRNRKTNGFTRFRRAETLMQAKQGIVGCT